MTRFRLRSSHPEGWAAAVWLLALVIAATLGATAVGIVWYLQTPRDVSTAQPDPYWPITADTTRDPRPVTLALTVTPAPELASPRSGTITALTCRSGGRIRSGAVVMTVDSQRIVAVATPSPLWRDLTAGTTGKDVRAWQSLLASLGLPAGHSGVFDSATSKATSKFATARALAWPEGQVPINSLVWIPASQATISGCVQQLGKVIPSDEVIFRLAPTLEKVILKGDPSGSVVPGARDLVVDDVTVPLGPGSSIDNLSHLAALQGTPLIQAALRDPNVPLNAVTQLHEPTPVASVPPSTLIGVEGSRACVVAVSGSPLQVNLLASSLGRVAVTFVSEPWPAEIELTPEPQICGHPK